MIEMKYLALLGRLDKISLAELESLFGNVRPVGKTMAVFEADREPDLRRLGGVQKIAEEMPGGYDKLVSYLENLPDGKITLGVSDYRRRATARGTQGEALKLKKILQRRGRSVRVLENKTAVLSTATAHHNQLAEKKNHVEILFTESGRYKLLGVQNISEYAKRDQARPARDARVGMLPPKLAQILINLCGEYDSGSRLLDPFCGTGVVLQEALLMGRKVVGTDVHPRMVEFSKKNLDWLRGEYFRSLTNQGKSGIIKGYSDFVLEVGDAMQCDWNKLLGGNGKIGAVATEVFLGQPISLPPAEIKLKQEMQTCRTIILGFLKNLGGQVEANTPVVMAIPAWLRNDGGYARLNILDEVEKLGYNVVKFSNLGQKDLLYFREGQIVAREIIVLRKN